MSEAASASRYRSMVLVARDVVDAINALPEPQADAVARAIGMIGELRGEPIELDVRRTPWAQWMALVPPEDPGAPVVIYRRLPQGDGDGWRVAALMPRDDYDRYRAAEQRGFFEQPEVRIATAAATDVAVATMGTISVFEAKNPPQRGGAGSAPLL